MCSARVEAISATGVGPVTRKRIAAIVESTEVWYPLPQRKGDHSPRSRCTACRPTTAASEFEPSALMSGGRRKAIERKRTSPHGAAAERRAMRRAEKKKAAPSADERSAERAALGASTLTGGVYY